jgi:CorA-like Mg2+ transporter protein
MTSARTTYQDRHSTESAEPSRPSFVWVSLRDPSPQELAAVQAEFDLPAPLVDDLGRRAKRPALEVEGELLVAVVKTASWAADEELVRLADVQLVLGDGLVVSVERDTAILDRVRQDLHADPEPLRREPGRRRRRCTWSRPGWPSARRPLTTPGRADAWERAADERNHLADARDQAADERDSAADEQV